MKGSIVAMLNIRKDLSACTWIMKIITTRPRPTWFLGTSFHIETSSKRASNDPINRGLGDAYSKKNCKKGYILELRLEYIIPFFIS